MDNATFQKTKADVLRRVKARTRNTDYLKINNYWNKRRYKRDNYDFQGRNVSERVQDTIERID
jgi:hypothetical protein